MCSAEKLSLEDFFPLKSDGLDLQTRFNEMKEKRQRLGTNSLHGNNLFKRSFTCLFLLLF